MSQSLKTSSNLNSGIKLSSGYTIPSIGLGVFQAKPEETIEAVTSAIEVGYTHIDTAILYRNETEVGDAIKKSGVKREDIFITTKLGTHAHELDPAMEFNMAGAVYSVNASLKKLGTDYIDLFLIHDPLAGKEGRLALWKALIEIKDQTGKLRSIGVSNFGIHHLKEIEEAGYELPSVNQIELHPQLQQKELVEYCKEKGIVLEAFAPLARGKYFDDPVLSKIAKKHNKQPAQVLVRWGLQKGFVVLPKSVHKARVAANADVFDFSLSDEEMAELDGLNKPGTEGVASRLPSGDIWFPVTVA